MSIDIDTGRFKDANVREQESLLDALSEVIYEQHRMFTPVYPWCFVRVLKKEQQRNGIILPATEQNKTLHEGIILAVWKPLEYDLEMTRHSEQHGSITTVHYTPKAVTKYRRESALKPGDHVLFPHWAGMPVDGFSEKQYRAIKEEGWKETQDGGIMATVEYAEKTTKPIAKLKELLKQTSMEFDAYTESYEEALLSAIDKKFLLVDRDGESVTLSGR